MKIVEKLACRLGNKVAIPSDRMEGHELVTHVCGHPLHLRSERTTLSLTPEALATAFLLPAASMSKTLKGKSIDSVWLKGSGRILAQANNWWSWHAQPPEFKFETRPPSRNPGVALPFSLGVDSFYSCFFADPKPDILVLAAGFDVPLQKNSVLLRMQHAVAAVAEAVGKDWTMIATDLRQHPLYRKSSWLWNFGGAVAFLGHLLERHVDTLLISSSLHESQLAPCGSHPSIDPLWSSSRLDIKHVGHDVFRFEKLRRLTQHPVAAPLVQKHLQVCWESPSDEGNCGRCGKCLLTRLNLHRCAPDFLLETMPDTLPLAEAIAALPSIPNELALSLWRELVGGPDPRVERALSDLIRRSETEILTQCRLKSTHS